MAFLIDAAALAGVKVLATEQYPKGLGPTVAELARRLPERPDKLAFSCCAVPNLVAGLKQEGLRPLGSEGATTGQWALLDYGDFAVDARLVQLQALPRPRC